MKTERFGLILVNLLLLFALSIFVSGCMTYNKALRKFGHLAKDSTHIVVRDTVIIPGDSIAKGYRTDTTVIHDVFQQGRARLTVDRNARTTTVKAECKPDTIYREIKANCPPIATFGVSSWYKKGFWIMLALLILAGIFFLFRYVFKLSMVKR
ncbi:hypothetical protein [Spirosoma aerolatum]|uniref:hypothetical protein n=1 Tax=Spirosoma aerolatum TaxID=1211326 RepID=UPI0009AE8010|nr:hypothetical protein [Spirosoma aerolatum]